MTALATNLPSKVEETLAICPRFRILVVGGTGVGKSSLISSIFNISLESIDIAHDRTGRADITVPYTSGDNPRFILHDSQGFEPANVDNWETVKRFLEKSANAEIKDRVHAIWLCIATPLPGDRIQQTGDEKLLSLAKELRIPVIAVFTKFDRLVVEHLRKARQGKAGNQKTPKENAQDDFEERMQGFRSTNQLVPCVYISTKPKYIDTLQKLTKVTRDSLHDVEGELWLPWAAAQQINARQKVEESIREGCKKYWVNLAQNSAFQGHRLIDCVRRIYDDVVMVWNFHDPSNILSGDYLFSRTLKITEEFTPQSDGEDSLSGYADPMSLATAIGGTFAQALGGIGIGVVVIKYLYSIYQAAPLTARYLGAYIIDVTLILHGLFIHTLAMNPPRPLTEECIDDAVDTFQVDREKIHGRVCNIKLADFERHIGELIRESLGMNDGDTNP